MMEFKIFQIADLENCGYGFMGWRYAYKRGFSFTDYKEVYSGEREKKYILDNLWEEFNINHPVDFRGHSLSVSDIVALKDKDKDYWYWYYCDSFGWEEITEIING